MTNKLLLLFTLFIAGLASAQTAVHQDTILVGKYIKIFPLSTHLYRYVASNFDVPSNGLICVDNKEALLIDAPEGGNVTDSLLRWITTGLGATVKCAVITHWHGQDRMGGIAAINELGIPSYCSNKTLQIATEKNLAHPAIGFDDSLVLHVGNVAVECRFLGAGHTTDNIVVWFPEEKVLFGGCLVKDLKSQTLGYIKDADMKAWPVTIQKVIDKFPDAALVFPGHFESGGKELLYHTLELTNQHKN